MAVMHRYHPELGPAHLCLRSFLHSIRFLCMEGVNVLARQTDKKVQQLQKKQPGQAIPLHMFVSDALAAARRHIGPAGLLSFEDVQRVVSQAATTFPELPPAAAAAYQARAAARAESRKNAIASEVVFLREQQTFVEAKREEEHEDRGIQHRLAQLKFRDGDWARLVQSWNEEICLVKNVLSLVAASSAALSLPSADAIAKVERALVPKPKAEVKSNFVRLLAWNRDFRGAVFMKEEPGQAVAHRLLFALQNPHPRLLLAGLPDGARVPANGRRHGSASATRTPATHVFV